MDKRFMIEDLTNGGVRYEETQAAALETVRFFHNSLKSDEIRLTDRKSNTWVDYRLNRNLLRNSGVL